MTTEEKALIGIMDRLERNDYELNKMNIFNHDTLDETDPKHERIRRDVTVEIGGPSAHIKFTVLTRVEHTIIKGAVAKILHVRQNENRAKLDRICQNRAASIAGNATDK